MKKTRLLGKITISFLLSSMIFAISSNTSAQPISCTSKVFDLSAPGTPFFRDKPLHNGTVLQSFAFDNVHKHTYVVQLTAGGIQLPGEPAPVSGANRSLNGDLTLTKLDSEGNELGHMYLKGFGHGVQIGLETHGETAYIWSETDSVAEGKEGWGTKLARFPFNDGAIMTPDSPELEKHQLIQGADRTTVNIDSANNLLTMRYRLNGSFYFALYNLQDVKQKVYKPIADVEQPSMGTFQGFASFGRHLYLLEGNAYGASGSVEPYGNTYITSVDWFTSKTVDKKLFTGGNDLTYREPEGMGVRIPDIKHPRKAQLSVGFASNFTPNRLANIYYLDRLISEKKINGSNN
ncbi:hypothetical protein [Fictibacillus terranigra]|uniref:P68 RBP/TagC-like beta-propeller domain-containing protein n=1 Tax=Fictibacillus terranigra TaxID=3058424 RepID=A0ABT8E8X2_9BACL|nr:hypothetical protein [Fictibacillus sp. CENA-BCM004]MDN4074350.1 hypothetical protein [Fictibacillus sp. CENA-BCM004]